MLTGAASYKLLPNTVDFIHCRGLLCRSFREPSADQCSGPTHFDRDSVGVRDCQCRRLDSAGAASGFATAVQSSVRAAHADACNGNFLRLDGQPAVEHVAALDRVADSRYGNLFWLRTKV